MNDVFLSLTLNTKHEPLKTNMTLENPPIFNRKCIFKWWMFDCHVSFQRARVVLLTINYRTFITFTILYLPFNMFRVSSLIRHSKAPIHQQRFVAQTAKTVINLNQSACFCWLLQPSSTNDIPFSSSPATTRTQFLEGNDQNPHLLSHNLW